MTDTIIDLIRHGEPVGGSMYRGHSIDNPLSDKGWHQMRQAIGENNQWQQIVSSPMLRCREFAKELANKYNLPIQIEDNFKEVGFGDWEGLSRQQVQQKNLTEYNNFYRNPVKYRPNNSEQLDNFINRVVTGYKNTSLQFNQQRVLIVAHAGVIRAILAHIVGAPDWGLYNFRIANAGISRINETKKEILFINHSFN